MKNFINENIEKSKRQCQELENNPIINSQESLNGESNSVSSSSCRGDSCNPVIIEEYEVTPIYSGDGYGDKTDNSVLTDDEDFSVPPNIPVINLEKSNSFTSTMLPATIKVSQATTSLLSTTKVIAQTTPQPTELFNITTHTMPTNSTNRIHLTTEKSLNGSSTVSITQQTTKVIKTSPPTTTIPTTTTIKMIPKPKIHVWIQGGDGSGDSLKV